MLELKVHAAMSFITQTRAASLLSVIWLTFLLYACTSAISADPVAQSANSFLKDKESGNLTPNPSLEEMQIQLWRDHPEYLPLVSQKHLKYVRMLRSVDPIYPAALGPVHAQVYVSYVVGVNGRIEDARALWSSDSRFDPFALNAMRQFTFTPAQGRAGPEREMEVLLFEFGGYR
ncbi:MAG TPA: hypothetical protein VHS76_02070 [Steroidobacteraceae bacterium]|jgi:hypothetical protein|nr:hypothetical protein [Steroidobacteraceae bacterium]